MCSQCRLMRKQEMWQTGASRRLAANDDRGDLMDSITQFDTCERTPSINIILASHVCVCACVNAYRCQNALGYVCVCCAHVYPCARAPVDD